jgi:hypothetical protein
MLNRATNTLAAVLGVLSLVTLSLAPTAIGQSRWALPRDGSLVRIEVLKPFLTDEDPTTFGTTATIVSGQAAVGPVLFQVELPVSHIGIEDSELAETDFGNPYVGVVRKLTGGGFMQAGLRFPLAGSDGGWATGLLGDFDHAEAYVPDLWSLSAAAGYVATFGGGLGLDGAGGATVFIPTEEGSDTDLFIDYRIRALFERGMVRIGAGISGRFLATGDEGQGVFGESKAEHHFGVTVSLLAGVVEPHAHFRLPFAGDLGDAVDYTFGLGLTARLGAL